LCFIRRDNKVLLIRKKRGLGAGKINGPGGRIEPGESPEQAAVRETTEEVGLIPAGLIKMADLSFQFADGYSLHCVVFFASRFSGTLEETEEADPFWCRESEIPYESMWADDRLWLSRALNGEPVSGYFSFDGDTMLTHSVATAAFPPAE
ncbi:MAG: 8-oxo-dGTP diphosphatase, partial [Spirochaetia bacterium]